MQLSELYLNRYLYKADQSAETDNTEYVSGNQTNYPSSFISYGGNAAIDVNTNTTTINGGKIRTGVIESTGYKYISGIYSSVGMQISLDNGAITSKQFAIDSAGNAYFAGAIAGSSMDVPNATAVNSWHVDSSGRMWSGANSSNYAIAPFRVNNDGSVYASNITLTGYIATGGAAADVNSGVTTINGGQITTNTITANKLTVSQLSSITADLGSITAGSITFAQTTDPGAKLKWFGGSRIWEDSSSNMGINAIGNQLYIYCASNQVALFQSGAKTQFFTDTSFQNTVYLSSGNNTYIWGNDNTNTMIGAQTYIYFKIGSYPGSEEMRLSSVGLTLQGYLYQPNSSIIVHGGGAGITSTLPATSGTLKNAIVPTSQGFKALACIESPEVWFMDFCTGTRTEDIDPLFLEVTVPPYHFIMCEGGEYQVWGKRKGHEDKRFEAKTGKEFVANERFLSMNKPSYQFN